MVHGINQKRKKVVTGMKQLYFFLFASPLNHELLTEPDLPLSGLF